ncbi:MAG: HAMP domain-containing histidine kinase [Planctomycetaceae bacterium]|nr:HAMP domain-containing histidine kinase [Planctomycetaceae bacterium]
MPRRPWQIWLAYLLILMLLLSGFGWLTVRVVELDRQEQMSRARVKQEEGIRLALWRMESLAMPIIAAEAARPYLAYRPYHASSNNHPDSRIPSPLLQLPSEYVLLNFQIDPQGRVESPQCPGADDIDWANRNGATPSTNAFCCPRVEELQASLDCSQLLSELPAETIPTSSVPFGTQNGLADAIGPNTYVTNQLAIPPQALSPDQQESSAKEFSNRAMKLQEFTFRSVQQQRQHIESSLLQLPVREGVSRPVWIDGRLLLARRVEIGGRPYIQGCWLDWNRLKADFETELADLLPDAQLEMLGPEQTAVAGRSLASMPVQIVPGAVTVIAVPETPTRISLAIAWAGVLLAAIAFAFLLYGVTSLSERRAAFVAAVTHELRTPLTTLQLYSDMLAGGMVSDDRQQRDYVQTLHHEAGRLSHLVDNVLALSRLERRSTCRHRETVTVSEFLARAEPRLRGRTEQASCEFDVVQTDAAGAARMTIEPTVIEQILLNLVDNACKYGCISEQGRVQLSVQRNSEMVEFSCRDWGAGLTPTARQKLFQRFSKSDLEAARTQPGLGLGLALSRELARSEGGDLLLESTGSEGTAFLLRIPAAD